MKLDEYRSKRFLIVDNYKTFAETLKQMIITRGAQRIDICHQGKEAVARCKANKYHVILMGYDLGDGQQNGQQALEELRTNGLLSRESIFILITGEVTQEMVLCALEHKPDSYLTKPFTQRDLINRIESSYAKKMSMAKVYQAMDSKQYHEVIKLCDHHIDNQSPYSSECLGIKSRQLYELGRYKDALEIYESKKADVNCQWALMGIGKIHFAKAEYRQAKLTFQQVIKRSRLYLAAYDWLAKTHEAMEEFEQAEHTLSTALKLSPRSIKRTIQLGELCEQSQNFEMATQAYQRTMTLAQNSVHNTANNHLNLARALSEQALQISDKTQQSRLQQEALEQLENVRTKFKTTDAMVESALASARIFNSQGNDKRCSQALAAAEKVWNESRAPLTADNKLAFAKTYAELGHTFKAENILEQLVIENTDDDEFLAKIDQIVENPISKKGKEIAQKAIKTGIGFYNKQDYAAAIKEFNSAIRLYPKHLGIKLNLIQALLLSYQENPATKDAYERGLKHLNQLGNMSPEHEQYQRYVKIKAKFDQVKL